MIETIKRILSEVKIDMDFHSKKRTPFILLDLKKKPAEGKGTLKLQKIIFIINLPDGPQFFNVWIYTLKSQNSTYREVRKSPQY